MKSTEHELKLTLEIQGQRYGLRVLYDTDNPIGVEEFGKVIVTTIEYHLSELPNELKMQGATGIAPKVPETGSY